MNALEKQPLLTAQAWETVKQKGKKGIEGWIHEKMLYKKSVIVLIGQQTASRPWVQYEIEKAWKDKRPLLGIRIHGIPSMEKAVDKAGPSPFHSTSGIPIFDPTQIDWYGRIDGTATYNFLRKNLDWWSDQGVVRRNG
ncbi:TIR domain-containing protein [Paractinoplanes lichenicola]